jgi:tetratricopeptide (TPR) repeat protein
MHAFDVRRLSLPILGTFLFVLVIVLYLPVLRHGFVGIDDGLLITQNAASQQMNPTSLWYVFTSYDPELYIPLTFVSYQLNFLMGGLQPFVYHLTNILLHAGSSVLVFGIAYLLLRRHRLAAFLVALLFAIHPVQVEAVAWAAARKDILSGFFFLVSFFLFLRSEEQGKERVSWGSVLAFFLGLLSKVTVALLPAVLLLWLWKEGRLSLRAIKRIVPFAVLSGLFIIIAVIGKRHNLSTLPLLTQGLLFCKSVMFALEKLVWPSHLSVMYEQVTPVSLLSWEFIVPIVFCLMLLGLVDVAIVQRWRTISFSAGYFLVLYVPVVATLAKNHMVFYASDRYVYLSSIGFFLLIGLAAERLILSAKKVTRRVTEAACALLFIALLTVSFLQEHSWENDITLFSTVVASYPSAIAFGNLGGALWDAKQPGAIDMLNKATMLDPANPWPFITLAHIAEDQGDIDGALADYRKAAANMDRFPILSMGDLEPYYGVGEELLRNGKIAEGLAAFEYAVARASDLAEPHYNLGIKYQEYHHTDQARQELEKAVAIHSLYPKALYHLAGVYGELGMLRESISTLERLLSIVPEYEKASEHLQELRRIVESKS